MSRFLILVLATSCAITCTGYGQQPPPPASGANGQNAEAPAAGATAASKPAPAASNVPMNEPVLTLKGACESKAGSTPPPDCVSSLTREQFEKLTNALQPADRGPVPPEIKRKFANQYAKLLIFADAARQLGLENDPKVEQIFTFAQNQILAEALNQHYAQEYAHPSDQAIQDYYNQNPKKFVEVTLERIVIPRPPAGGEKPAPSEAEQKAYAEKIRERWIAGEDPVKLQKEAMDHNGVSSGAPDVNVGARRAGSMPDAQSSVFDLKAGEYSQIFSDPAMSYIYKVLSTRELPLSDVKSSISGTLQHQLYSDKIQQLQSSVTPVLNEAYFGPEPPPGLPTNIIRHGETPPAAARTPPPPPGNTTAPNPAAPPK